MGLKLGVGIMALALALYLLLLGQRAVVLLLSGEPVGIAMGAALILLPILGVWGLARELVFGAQSARLGKILAASGETIPELGHRASGRPVRTDAQDAFPTYQKFAEDNPGDWRAWFKLGVIYNAAGDRKRARNAIRQAITLERATAA